MPVANAVHIVLGSAHDCGALSLQAINAGLAVPGFSTSLAYYDTYRRESLPANLVQVTPRSNCTAYDVFFLGP